MIPSRPVHKSSAETMGNFVANKDMLKNTTYKEDFQRYVLMNKEPVMCRKIAPTIKMSKVLRPPYEILEASPTSTSSYRMNFTDFMKSHHLSDQLPAAGLTTSGGPIKSQRQTYSFQPLIAKELSKTEESLSKQRHSSVQLSRSLYLPDIVEQIENRWPYLEHKKDAFIQLSK
ncbi:unnamed protein product [Heterobilharzia americana]|nr:unnamed protein product [Heterobilharzia americana]